MTLETKILACLSTAHLSADVAAELEAILAYPAPLAARLNPALWQAHILMDRWLDYGWFIWVGSPARAHMPGSLKACLDLAETSGAAWLQFDRDCAPIADLPVYDW